MQIFHLYGNASDVNHCYNEHGGNFGVTDFLPNSSSTLPAVQIIRRKLHALVMPNLTHVRQALPFLNTPKTLKLYSRNQTLNVRHCSSWKKQKHVYISKNYVFITIKVIEEIVP